MPFLPSAMRTARETIEVYWLLVRIMVPVTILAEALSRIGVIEAVAPAFAPVMHALGLPAELGLAWLTGMLVGVWGAVPLVFTLVSPGAMSVADITVFSALVLFAHGLPIEQKIIRQAGPAMAVTTLLRIAGGLLYAFLLHSLLAATGWLSSPLDPVWIPMSATPGWPEFLAGLAESLAWMFVILLGLSLGLQVLKATGILGLMMKALSPFLRLIGIKGEAEHLTAIGLFLGISYGAGLLIREARSGAISPRQIFLSCVFMGFAHSVIEDTLIVMALGADIVGILVGRLIFAFAAVAAIAAFLRGLPDETFHRWIFRSGAPASADRNLTDTADA
ncbi:nucleoside recognition domain-containing protein [Oricola indica]|jgi:spore maturation protein SpmB|uniref:nucleoside recognition domain-containing protein n=1 Tax=Oricola indica TaxID=2872591 RepID=UPI001CBBA1D1|nr:nucleoside recognition domain-containing protein [Oricola indica]